MNGEKFVSIIPIRRRRFGVSKTAKREQDWKFVSKTIEIKAHLEKYLRSIGK